MADASFPASEVFLCPTQRTTDVRSRKPPAPTPKSALVSTWDVPAVRELHCDVGSVITLVDRLAGAEQLFRESGITNYRPIFTIRDLGVTADARGPTEVASG